MTEADFEALNAHLVELQPILDVFCARYNFSYVDRRSIGRYPRVRIERVRETTIYFDLSMGLDESGNRFERFDRALPYELGAGASFVEHESAPDGIRYQASLWCFTDKPFEQVGSILLSEMERCLPLIGSWTVDYLRNNGMTVKLK